MLVRRVVIQYPPVSRESVPQRSIEMFQRYSKTAVNGKECSVPSHPNERYVSSHLIMRFLVAVDAEDVLKKACGFTCELITWLLHGLSDKFNEQLYKAHTSVHVSIQHLSWIMAAACPQSGSNKDNYETASFILPPVLQPSVEAFEEYHVKVHNGRKSTWFNVSHASRDLSSDWHPCDAPLRNVVRCADAHATDTKLYLAISGPVGSQPQTTVGVGESWSKCGSRKAPSTKGRLFNNGTGRLRSRAVHRILSSSTVTDQ